MDQLSQIHEVSYEWFDIKFFKIIYNKGMKLNISKKSTSTTKSIRKI